MCGFILVTPINKTTLWKNMNSLWQVVQTLWIQLATFRSTLRQSYSASSLLKCPKPGEKRTLPFASRDEDVYLYLSCSIPAAPNKHPGCLWQEFNMEWKAAISKEEMNQSMRALQGTGLRGGNQSRSDHAATVGQDWLSWGLLVLLGGSGDRLVWQDVRRSNKNDGEWQDL